MNEITKLNLDLNTNIFTYKHHKIKIHPPQAAEFLYTLILHHPHAVKFQAIYKALWGNQKLSGQKEQIRYNTNKLRLQLEGTGIEIKNIHGVGYRLVEENPLYKIDN